MTSMFLTLWAPVLVLWIGACVFYVLDRWVQPQDAGVAEVVVLLLAIGALLWGARLPQDGAPYAELAVGQALAEAGWPGATPALRVDAPTKGLALALLAAAAAAALASLAESGLLPLQAAPGAARAVDARVVGRAGRMAALGAALLVLFAGDWATLALAWVVCDLFLLYARLAVTEDEQVPELRWTVVLSLVGAVCLGLVAVQRPEAGGRPGALGCALAVAALVLRVLPWPLPAWPLRFDRRHTLWARVFGFLIPTLLGVYVCSRLAPWVWSAEPVAQGSRWVATVRGPVLTLWAAAALLVSAFKAWSARDPGVLIASTTLYGAALIVLGCALDLPPSWLLLMGTGVVLSVCALCVSWTMCPYLDAGDPRTWWWVAPVGVALLSLAGAPLTVGFAVRSALYAGLLEEGRWWALPLLVAAEAGVLGALLRVLLDVECVSPEWEGAAGMPAAPHRRAWQRQVAYGAGAVLALGILALGVFPALLGAPGLGEWLGVPTVAGWAALLLPVAGALLLYRERERLMAWMEDWSPMVERLLDVRWFYRGIERAIQVVGAMVWGGSLVVEGAGYLAWVTLFGLVVLLLVWAVD